MKTVVLVEGEDERMLLELLLSSFDGKHGIEVEGVGGVSGFAKVLNALPDRPDFATGQVKFLGLVRDADGSAEAAHQSLAQLLSNAGFAAPAEAEMLAEGTPSTITFIVAKQDSTGMLEDLCMKSVSTQPGYHCVDEFFTCAKAQGLEPRNLSKARARAWLSLQHDWDLSVGKAAKAGIWNLEDPAFDALKGFLRQISHLASS